MYGKKLNQEEIEKKMKILTKSFMTKNNKYLIRTFCDCCEKFDVLFYGIVNVFQAKNQLDLCEDCYDLFMLKKAEREEIK